MEFAGSLESKQQGDRDRARQEILAAYGAYRDVLPPTEEFEAQKPREIAIEDREP